MDVIVIQMLVFLAILFLVTLAGLRETKPAVSPAA